MLPALRFGSLAWVGLLSGLVVLSACAQADESESGSKPDASTSDAGGAAGGGGTSGTGGIAGTAGAGGLGGSAGVAGSSGTSGAGGSGGSGGTGATGGTGGYAGTGGTGIAGAAGAGDAGISCGGQVCTDWLCENTGLGLSMNVYGCCQQTNECGAVNQQGGALCVPVAVVESVLNMTCKPD